MSKAGGIVAQNQRPSSWASAGPTACYLRFSNATARIRLRLREPKLAPCLSADGLLAPIATTRFESTHPRDRLEVVANGMDNDVNHGPNFRLCDGVVHASQKLQAYHAFGSNEGCHVQGL
jgi:hypothetical protein